jgi:hypothetical protein
LSIQLMRLSSRGLARLKDKQTLLGTCLCVPTCKKLFTAFGGGKGQETRRRWICGVPRDIWLEIQTCARMVSESDDLLLRDHDARKCPWSSANSISAPSIEAKQDGRTHCGNITTEYYVSKYRQAPSSLSEDIEQRSPSSSPSSQHHICHPSRLGCTVSYCMSLHFESSN